MLLDQIILKNPSVKRHLAKTITWRIIGTIDTMILCWLVTGDPITGLKIGGLEILSKMVLYFIHERIWYKMNLYLAERHLKISKKTTQNYNHMYHCHLNLHTFPVKFVYLY